MDFSKLPEIPRGNFWLPDVSWLPAWGSLCGNEVFKKAQPAGQIQHDCYILTHIMIEPVLFVLKCLLEANLAWWARTKWVAGQGAFRPNFWDWPRDRHSEHAKTTWNGLEQLDWSNFHTENSSSELEEEAFQIIGQMNQGYLADESNSPWDLSIPSLGSSRKRLQVEKY